MALNLTQSALTSAVLNLYDVGFKIEWPLKLLENKVANSG